jgi:CBS domain-containing protein
MRIEKILQDKGREVVTIGEDRSVLDAVKVLVDHNIGGVVVVEGGRPAGILTERDILRLTARSPGELGSIQVGAAMTRDLITASPSDKLMELMDVMTENKIRHVPVMDEGLLVGIVTIGDLLNACRSVSEEENSHMREYIQGGG